MVRVGTDDHPFDIEIRNCYNEPLSEYPLPGTSPRSRFSLMKNPYYTAHQHVYIEAPPPNKPQTYSILVQPLRTFNYNETLGFYFFPSFDGVRPTYGKKMTKNTLQRVKFATIVREKMLDGTTSATRAYLKEREVEGSRVRFNSTGEGSIRIVWVEIMDEAQAKPGTKAISAKAHRTTDYKKGKKIDYTNGAMMAKLSAALSDSDNDGDVVSYKAEAMVLIDKMEPTQRTTSGASTFSGPDLAISSTITTVTNGNTTMTTTTTTTTTTNGRTPPARPKLSRSGSSKLRAWIEATMNELEPHYSHPPTVSPPVMASEEIAAKQALADRTVEIVKSEHIKDEYNSNLASHQYKQLRSITFHYRSRETLQRLGIIPLPRPQPSRAYSSAYKTYLRESTTGCTPGAKSYIDLAGPADGTDEKVETPRESQPEFSRPTFEVAAKHHQIKAPRHWIWDKDEDNLYHAWTGSNRRCINTEFAWTGWKGDV